MDKAAAVQFLTRASEVGASDVHIAVGSPVFFRINGELQPQTKQLITPAQAEQFVKAVLSDAQMKRFMENKGVDVSYSLKTGARLRINCMFERDNMSLVARIIPSEIPQPETLGLQALLEKFRPIQQGLILFTGPTGTGKSTSLASLIRTLSLEKALNVITLEDPIEFYFPEGKGIVRQRQYGDDFLSFPDGLKYVLRQDPNIVMVGEMRDPETIAAALTLAETGHIIFATLHTPNTIQTIDRIIDVFPPSQQSQVRTQLSFSLRAVVAQRLLPKVDGGRIALREILLNTPAVANIIRDNRLQELKSVLQTHEPEGMCTFERAAKQMLKDGLITKEVCDIVNEAL